MHELTDVHVSNIAKEFGIGKKRVKDIVDEFKEGMYGVQIEIENLAEDAEENIQIEAEVKKLLDDKLKIVTLGWIRKVSILSLVKSRI